MYRPVWRGEGKKREKGYECFGTGGLCGSSGFAVESELLVDAGSLDEGRFRLRERRILEENATRCVAVDGEWGGYFGHPHAQIDCTTDNKVTGVVGFQRFSDLFS